MASTTRLFGVLQRRWWLALRVMGGGFVLFGLASPNLLTVLQANLGFLLRHGADAVGEGGLRRFGNSASTATSRPCSTSCSRCARRRWSSA